MHGRMIHVRKNGEYVRQPQMYDARGRVGLSDQAIDSLLTVAESARNGQDGPKQDPARPS